MAERRQVLQDHVRVGKRFRPPFLHYFPDGLRDPQWVDRVVPELVWIALLQDRFELGDGPELALAAAKALRTVRPRHHGLRASDYGGLTDEERAQLLGELEGPGVLTRLAEAVAPLLALYPTCPMRQLFSDPGIDHADALAVMRRVLAAFADRWGRDATLVQTTVIYVATGCGFLTASREVGNIRAIVDFPKTEESRRVGAFSRAMTSGLLGPREGEAESSWPSEFWNRGFELQACETGDAV